MTRTLSAPLRLLVALLVALALLVPAGMAGLDPARAADETPSPSSSAEKVTGDDGNGATVTGAKVAEEGKGLVFTGTGMKNTAGTDGNAVALKLDAGGVSTKLEVKHPVTGVVQKNKTIVATAKADAEGNWSATVPWPTVENSDIAAGDFAAGTSHSVQVLSGSMTKGDSVHNPSVEFSIGAGEGATTGPTPDPTPAPTLDPNDETTWVTATSNDGKATLKVQPFTTGEGSKIRVKGAGWKNTKGASVVSLKVKYKDATGASAEYAREDSQINDYLKNHPNSEGKPGAADPTTWILGVPDAADADPAHGLVHVDAEGNFEAEVEAPQGLQHAKEGEYYAIFAQSGRNLPGDASRQATTDPVPVDGTAGKAPQEVAPDTKCVNVTSSPQVTVVEPNVKRGGTLHLIGSGYCNAGGQRGAAKVAVKLDEAMYAHPKGKGVNSNLTIWQLIDTDQSNGTFDVQLQLPDGTEATSSPAFPDGAHSLRFLTGSLRKGDMASTYGGQGVVDFVVGQYSPQGAPDPLDPAQALTSGTRHGVKATVSGNTMTVTVPSGKEGDWVHTSAYADGSRRNAWLGEWKKLDAKKQVSYTIDRDVLVDGKYQVAVQNGNQGSFGQLIGWADMTLASASSESSSSQGQTSTGSSAGSTATPGQASGLRGGGYQTVSGSDYAAQQNAASGNRSSSLAAAAQDQVDYVVVGPAQSGQQRVVVKKVRKVVKKKVTASPSASDEATDAPAEAQDDSQAAQSTVQKKNGIFTWENLLLVAAAGIVLALVLTGKKKTPAAGTAADGAKSGTDGPSDATDITGTSE